MCENYADLNLQVDRKGLHGKKRRHDLFICCMIDDKAVNCALSWLLGQGLLQCKSSCNLGFGIDTNDGLESCLRHASIASCSISCEIM